VQVPPPTIEAEEPETLHTEGVSEEKVTPNFEVAVADNGTDPPGAPPDKAGKVMV
jgi:hypothetical protein